MILMRFSSSMDTRLLLVHLILSGIVLHLAVAQDLTGCGVTKGCFKQPPTCTGNDCMAYVTWEPIAGGLFRFAMRAERSAGLGWVAFGLRPSNVPNGMSPAEVYACTMTQEVRRSENVPTLNSESRTIPNNTVVTESIAFADNVITCQFTRNESLVGDSSFSDISGDNEYYILLAMGSAINGDGSIVGNKHTDRWHNPVASKLSAVAVSPPVTNPMPDTQLTGCDETKGCFRNPNGCTGSDCTAYVTWQTLQNGLFRFTLMGQRSEGIGWVAFGLRPAATTSGMSPADVYACTSNMEVRRSENVQSGGLNSQSRTIPANTIVTESATFQNNMIMCQFTRVSNIEGDSTFYNISGDNEYFILLAVGNTINADGSIQANQHSTRVAAGSASKLNKFAPIFGNDGSTLRKAHASLMVIAWIGFASIGITLARFFKPMWPTSNLCGTKVWFAIHRSCMVTCVVCFCTAFVLIFVAVGGFVETSETIAFTHAILGILVVTLGIINPIMAIFRPHPGTEKRPIFNWAHWGVGTFAHLLGMVTIFLGIGYDTSLLSGLKQYAFWAMVVFVCFHILIWILFEVQRCMTESQGRNNDIPLKGTGGNSTDQLAGTDDPPPGTTAKNILLFVYVLAVIIMVVFLVVSIAIA